MKGFYIFEESINQLQKEATVACFKLGDISHIFNTKLKPNAMVSAEVEITASVKNTITKANCNKDDTYDFETGALISLMKMCGVDKVVRACNEAFSEDTFKTYATKYERELNELKKDFDKIKDLKEFYKKNYEDVKEHYGKLGDKNKYLIEDINKKLEYLKEKDEEIKRLNTSICAKDILNNKLLEENSRLKYIKSCNESTIESLEKTRGILINKNNELIEENKKLKSDKDKSWKNYQRKFQKKQDRINELEAQVKASEDDKLKNIEYYEKEIKRLNASICAKGVLNGKLLKDYNTAQSAYEVMVEKSADLMDKVKKLEEENEKLKDELRLKEDAINEWKQTLREQNTKIGDLVCENENLKLDCEKLQHGYNDMIFCGGRQNGKQYTFLVDLFKKLDQKKVDAAYKEAYDKWIAQPIWQKEVFKQIHKDQLASLLESGKYLYKIPTKREEMWEKILEIHKKSNIIIVVEKEDVDTFLHEIEDRIPEITWASGQKIFEAKGTIKDIYGALKTCDRVYFRLRRDNELSYSSDPDIYRYMVFEHVSYLPPMRWDLFKKGRLVAKVSKENYAEFCSRVFSHFDKVGVHAFNHDCKFGYFMFNKDTDYVERILASDHGDAKEINRHKVVDWEVVR